MSNSNSESKFAIGFIVGVAAGLAIGFLFAPKSGAETRELLSEKVAAVGEKVREIVDGVGGKVREVGGDREKIYKEACKQPRVKPYTEEL
jgi:gas vesicle protein